MGKPWQKHEIRVIENNYQVMFYSDLALLLPGRDELSVRNFCKKRRLIKNPKRIMTQGEVSFIETNYLTMSYEQIANLLGRSTCVVGCYCSRNKLNKGHRKYTYNESFFDTPSTQSTYWAGLLAADGSVDDNRGTVNLTLKRSDGYQVELFKDVIKYTGPVYHGNGVIKGKKYPRTTLGLNSAWPLIAQLGKHYNIGTRKSLTLGPPNIIDEQLLKSYIVGYLDGDGSILLRDRKFPFTVGFVGSYDFMLWIKDCFDTWYPPFKTVATVLPDHNIFRYRISGKRAHSVLTDLAKLDVPLLKRKWEKVSEVLG